MQRKQPNESNVENEENNDNTNILPNDIIGQEILTHLTLSDARNLALTNKRMNHVVPKSPINFGTTLRIQRLSSPMPAPLSVMVGISHKEQFTDTFANTKKHILELKKVCQATDKKLQKLDQLEEQLDQLEREPNQPEWTSFSLFKESLQEKITMRQAELQYLPTNKIQLKKNRK